MCVESPESFSRKARNGLGEREGGGARPLRRGECPSKKGGELVCGLAGQVGTLTARAPSSIDNWGPGLRQVSFHRKPSALIRKAGHVIWVLPLILTLDPKTYPFRGDEVCIARCLGCCPGKFGPGISFSRKFDRGLLGKLAN